MCRTPALGCRHCGLTSLSRVHFCLYNLHFPLGSLPKAQLSTDAFLPSYHIVCIFLKAFFIQESFCQFPVSFPWNLFLSRCIAVYSWREESSTSSFSHLYLSLSLFKQAMFGIYQLVHTFQYQIHDTIFAREAIIISKFILIMLKN